MNIEEIKARLSGLAQQTKKRKDIWKPKDKHIVRLIQYPHGADPFVELGFHYEIQPGGVLCPKQNFGEECVICEFAEKLRAWKDEDGNDKPESVRKKDFEFWKLISVKPVWFVAMIERDKDGGIADGPKFWRLSKSAYERLLGMCVDPKLNKAVAPSGGEGTDVLFNADAAFDLEVNFKQALNKDGKGNQKNFPVTDIELAELVPTKLHDSKKKVKELVEGVQNMKDVYPEVSSAEVKKMFVKFLNSQSETDAGTENSGVEYKPNSAEKPVEGGLSIEEAFGDLTD